MIERITRYAGAVDLWLCICNVSVCRYAWVVPVSRGKLPERCASVTCKSRRWNDGTLELEHLTSVRPSVELVKVRQRCRHGLLFHPGCS